MKSESTPTWALPPTGLRFLVIVLLVLGIFFRFVNLDRKVYWCDETYTSLRISGYTAEEFVQQVFKGKVIDVKSLQKYQRPNPEKSVIDTIKGLAAEEPQHSPFYYVMARFWVQMFGSSVAVTRSLSALISLLAFPAIYWLCLELFESPLTGWVSIALLSVSPFHVLYAQEAREYSLWTVSILLSSAALLRAIRKQTKLSWGIYAITLTLSFYSFLFSGWMVIGHGIYVILIKGFRLNKTVTSYLLASMVGLMLFVPWFLVVINNYTVYTSTTSTQLTVPIWVLLKSWARNLSFVFFDAQAFLSGGFSDNDPASYWHPLTYLIPLVLGLVGYAIYFLFRHTPERIRLFVLTLIGSIALPLVLVDLYMGWRLTSFSRYLVPCWLGIQLTVAYLLANKITANSPNSRQQKLWQVVVIALISGGILSCTVSSQAEALWNKGSYYNSKIAHIINQANRPLLIGYSSAMCDMLSLSYLLNPKVKLLLLPIFPGSELLIKIPERFNEAFLFDPHNANFRSSSEKAYNPASKIIYNLNDIKLWKLK